ncbi:MAG: isochorismatase family protein [Thermoplasmatota archaeon]
MPSNNRSSEIVSPITDKALGPKTRPDDARARGQSVYDHPTAQNSVMLLIDHQIGLLSSLRDTSSLAELKSNVVGLARVAKALDLPVLISSSNAQWQNGDTLPELKALFPDVKIIRRTGIINCYEDPTFRREFERTLAETGRTHVIIAGVTIGTCCAMPTLSMLQDGYKVFPVVDACGAWNKYEADAAILRMANAGAEPVTVFALACELQRDWKLPTADAMFEPFKENLPEYAFVIQNFWNNANTHAVKDPFNVVKAAPLEKVA